MTITITLKSSRNYPDVGTVGKDAQALGQNIQTISDALDIGQRATKNIDDSFVRVHELVDLGLVTKVGTNQLQYTPPAAATALPDFVRGATWSAGGGAAVALPTNDVIVEIPRACTLKEVLILTTGGPGNCTVGCYKGVIGAYPPASDITGGVPPQITAANTYDNTTLSGWTTAFSAGDLLRFSLSAPATFTSISIQLRMG